MDFEYNIDAYDNGGDDGRFGKEMKESIERTSANLKANWEVGLQMHLKVWKMVMLDSSYDLKCSS
jgi:hypothetical protein